MPCRQKAEVDPSNALQHTLFELREMHKLAAEGRALDQLPDEQLAQLITFLMDHRCVLEVRGTLCLSDTTIDPQLPMQIGRSQGALSTHLSSLLPSQGCCCAMEGKIAEIRCCS